MASVDELKALANTKLGFARPNRFLVTLPSFGGGGGKGNGVAIESISAEIILPSFLPPSICWDEFLHPVKLTKIKTINRNTLLQILLNIEIF